MLYTSQNVRVKEGKKERERSIEIKEIRTNVQRRDRDRICQ